LMSPIKLQEIFYNLMCDQSAGNLLQFDAAYQTAGNLLQVDVRSIWSMTSVRGCWDGFSPHLSSHLVYKCWKSGQPRMGYSPVQPYLSVVVQ
jgi:hypothetical protein